MDSRRREGRAVVLAGGWCCLLMPNKQEMASYVYRPGFSAAFDFDSVLDELPPLQVDLFGFAWSIITRTSEAFRFPQNSVSSGEFVFAVCFVTQQQGSGKSTYFKSEDKDLTVIKRLPWWATVCFSCISAARCTDAAFFFLLLPVISLLINTLWISSVTFSKIAFKSFKG